MKKFLYSGTSLILLLTACTPCGQVRIESFPPAAVISELGADSRGEGMGILPEQWTVIGRTPLTVSSCRLRNELKARWDGRELFLPEYHGSERIDRKSTRLNSSHIPLSRMPSSA